MNFTVTQISFLQNLIAGKPQHRQHGPTAMYFVDHYNIGIRIGRQIEYVEKDYAHAELLLRNENLPVEAIQGVRRAETAPYSGISEKQFSMAPHADSVAVKIISGRCFDGNIELKTPGAKYLVLPVAEAVVISADRLLVVENADTFRHLENFKWIDFQGLNVMAIFRGDPRFKLEDALDVLQLRSEPTWGFYDFDPAGLAMAGTLPRLERIITPDEEWLKASIRSHNRTDLYSEQLRQWESMLDRWQENSELTHLWQIMKKLKRGLPQEWMEEAK